MSVSKVKSVVGHPALFLPLPVVGAAKLKSIALDRWRELPLDQRAPARSAAMVDIVGHNFVALIVDTLQHELRWRIVGPREQLWALYDGMLDTHGGRSRDTVIVSAPFIGAEVRRQGGGGHIDCESPQFMTQTLAFRVESLGGGQAPTGNETPSQWPSSGPAGVVAGQSLLTAEGAVSLQGAPIVTVTDDSGNTTTGVIVPPS
jgi:hypothetical protein